MVERGGWEGEIRRKGEEQKECGERGRRKRRESEKKEKNNERKMEERKKEERGTKWEIRGKWKGVK